MEECKYIFIPLYKNIIFKNAFPKNKSKDLGKNYVRGTEVEKTVSEKVIVLYTKSTA